MSQFLDALHSGRVLLMDGAMGTELHKAGLSSREHGELWNLTHPEKVRAIHRAYVEAGAEGLLTNTFQANPPALAKHHQESKLRPICETAVELARSVSHAGHLVLGDLTEVVGPAEPKLPIY